MIDEGYVEPTDNFDQGERIQFSDHSQETEGQFVEPYIQTKPVITEGFPELDRPVEPPPMTDEYETDIYERRQNAMTPAVTNISQEEHEQIPVVIEDVKNHMIKPEKYFKNAVARDETGMDELAVPRQGVLNRNRSIFKKFKELKRRKAMARRRLAPTLVPIKTRTRTQIQSEISTVARQALTEQNIETTPQTMSIAEQQAKQAWIDQQKDEIARLRSEAEAVSQVTPAEGNVAFNMTMDTLKQQGIAPTADNVKTALNATADEVAKTKAEAVNNLSQQFLVKEQELANLVNEGAVEKTMPKAVPVLIGVGFVSLLLYGLLA